MNALNLLTGIPEIVARIPSKMDAVATEKAEDRKPGAH
jgi:hypothetical protein